MEERRAIEALVEALEEVAWGWDTGAGSIMDDQYCRACNGTPPAPRGKHPVGVHEPDCIVGKALALGREALT
jgi:hypothetical protein